MSDINTATVDSLKVLDPKRPIREADMSSLRLECPPNSVEKGGSCDARCSLIQSPAYREAPGTFGH